MSESPINRVWATLTAAESAEVTRVANERGIRQSDLVRSAVLAFIGQPEPRPDPDNRTADAVTRLVALASVLERQITALGAALPTAEQMGDEREEIRGSLFDLANGIGVIAGSVVPDAEPDDGGRANFGL